MRREVKSMLPAMRSTQSHNEFQSLCSASNIEPGIDNEPLSDDDVASVAKEFWEEKIPNDPNEDSIVTFKERMELLKQRNKGFRWKLLNDTTGKLTGCVW